MLQMYRILNSHRTDPDQFLRDESFRRTLWLIYILDCFLTSTPGRYSALNPNDTVDVSLPCTDMNFVFGNAVYVKTLSQQLDPVRSPISQSPTGDVGDFGYIVLASTIWRDVVNMLTGTSLQNFREEVCTDLIAKIEAVRASLSMQFVDKPGQINLHMTMGSGYTFAMLHCLLHCSSIFVHRRRLLQEVTAPNFSIDAFRMSAKCHDIVDRLFTSCHTIISLLNAFETGAEKDHLTCFPIFMLFSAFTSSATVAYLSLKGLTPSTAVETASHIVEDGLRFMTEGTDNWPLMSSWLRHLTVMQRVLNNDAAALTASRHNSNAHTGIKEEVSSNADTNGDPMDYDPHGQSGSVPPQHGPTQPPLTGPELARAGSEPAVSIPRRPGITTINGNSGNGNSGSVSGATVSPPPANHQHQYPLYGSDTKQPTPDASQNGSVTAQEHHATSQDMTAPELCTVFERQLLEMDDLAAFMGGGV